jgi:hypothetical protein
MPYRRRDLLGGRLKRRRLRGTGGLYRRAGRARRTRRALRNGLAGWGRRNRRALRNRRAGRALRNRREGWARRNGRALRNGREWRARWNRREGWARRNGRALRNGRAGRTRWNRRAGRARWNRRARRSGRAGRARRNRPAGRARRSGRSGRSGRRAGRRGDLKNQPRSPGITERDRLAVANVDRVHPGAVDEDAVATPVDGHPVSAAEPQHQIRFRLRCEFLVGRARAVQADVARLAEADNHVAVGRKDVPHRSDPHRQRRGGRHHDASLRIGSTLQITGFSPTNLTKCLPVGWGAIHLGSADQKV